MIGKSEQQHFWASDVPFAFVFG